jgi:hypothetical protein
MLGIMVMDIGSGSSLGTLCHYSKERINHGTLFPGLPEMILMITSGLETEFLLFGLGKMATHSSPWMINPRTLTSSNKYPMETLKEFGPTSISATAINSQLQSVS